MIHLTRLSNLSNARLSRASISTALPQWASKANPKSDLPLDGHETPYQRPKRKCILCRSKIQLDYKNTRLLSQFVSSLNGDIYDKHITGLCEAQQTILEREIKKSRKACLMPKFYKDPRYNKDPMICDPDRPQRPNPY